MARSKQGYKRGIIKRDIKRWVSENSVTVQNWRWYCGITKHSDRTRIVQHIREKGIEGLCWHPWNAGTFENAHEIEVYFSGIGMANAPTTGGATSESKFVYVFKQYPTLIDEFAAFLESL